MNEKNPQRFYGQPVSPNAEFFIGTFASEGDEKQEYYVVSHESGYLCILLKDSFGNLYYGDIIAPNYPGIEPGKERFLNIIDDYSAEVPFTLEELSIMYAPEPSGVVPPPKDNNEEIRLKKEMLDKSFEEFDANLEASMSRRASTAYRKSTGG